MLYFKPLFCLLCMLCCADLYSYIPAYKSVSQSTETIGGCCIDLSLDCAAAAFVL